MQEIRAEAKGIIRDRERGGKRSVGTENIKRSSLVCTIEGPERPEKKRPQQSR